MIMKNLDREDKSLTKGSKRVLISGAAGFAGSHLLRHLLTKTDWDIVGIASWKHKGLPERVEEAVNGIPEWRDRVTIITHDLESPIPEMTAKRIGHCDYILNLAANSHVDRSITDPAPFILNNVNVAINMLEFARKYPPDVFLQFGTDEEYGSSPLGGKGHPEWDTTLPSNPYSSSKVCQAAIAISYWRTYSVPLILTNTMNLVGESQDCEKYTSKIIKALLNDEVVTVHGTPDKIGERNYLHARNMADAVLFILNNVKPVMYDVNAAETVRPERINIVGDIKLNNLELAQKIAEIMGKTLKYEFVDFHTNLRPGHDLSYSLDGTKLKNLGWTAPLSFDETLKSYIEWSLKNPRWFD
jgi:dTDP-glucose 4,6-dehydratase